MSDLTEIWNRKPKRIVTGQRPDGTSYFARVEEVDEDVRGIGSYRMWANDHLPVELPFLGRSAPLDSNPTDEETPEALRKSNSQPRDNPNSLRIHLHKMAPGTVAAPRAPGDPIPGLHWHNTFDVQWLMAGELTVIMDDGSEVLMQPGDAVIQHGTNHAWRAGPDGCVLMIFLMGANRVGVTPPVANKQPEQTRHV